MYNLPPLRETTIVKAGTDTLLVWRRNGKEDFWISDWARCGICKTYSDRPTLHVAPKNLAHRETFRMVESQNPSRVLRLMCALNGLRGA
jgi:hypothetical protein